MTALVVAFPHRLINPGSLMKGHQEFKNNCLGCHEPFAGASMKCISCHKPADIGVRNVAGRVLPVRSVKTLFHSGFAGNSCVECHTDHKGLNPKRAVNNFRHDSLSTSLKNNCNACHRAQKPQDNLHRQVGESCASCHDTVKWKNAAFDHTRLVSGQQCISCHKSDKPLDSLHRQTGDNCTSCHDTVKWKNVFFDHGQLSASGNQCTACHAKDEPGDALHRQMKSNCSECHTITRWKPATFDHDRYFRLDGDHRASCVTCHPDPKNYKAYTCYNCHEHSPSRIAGEHRKEGIRNYDNCIKCHRDASGEHEAGEGGHHGEGRGDDD